MEYLTIGIIAGIIVSIILQIWILFYTMKVKQKEIESKMVNNTKILLRKLDKMEYELKRRGKRKWRKI